MYFSSVTGTPGLAVWPVLQKNLAHLKHVFTGWMLFNPTNSARTLKSSESTAEPHKIFH